MCPHLVKEALVESIYQSVTDAGQVPVTMASMADEFRANGVQALVYSLDASKIFLCFSGRVDPAADQDYIEHYHQTDFRIRRAVRAPFGIVYQDDDFISDEERRHSPFHQEFLKRYDCERVLLVTAPISSASIFMLAVARSARQKTFDTTTGRQVLAYLPHLRRAAQMHLKVLHEKARREDAESLADLFGFGLIVLSVSGCVCQLNAAAERILANDSMVQLKDGRLAFKDVDNARRFNRALHDLTERLQRHGRKALALVRLSDSNTNQRFDALVCALPATPGRLLTSAPRLVVCFIEAGQAKGHATAIQSSLYGFTPAEQRCAELLATGASVDDIGAQLNMARNTVRAHLRSVFAKTGTKRQAELVSLMTRDLAALADLLDLE